MQDPFYHQLYTSLIADLDDHSLRNTPLAEVYALVEHLDSYRPSLQADIQNLTAHLSPLIEDRCLPDQRLKLEILTESQITSGVLATLSLKELFELSDGYSHLLTEAASSDLSAAQSSLLNSAGLSVHHLEKQVEMKR